MIPREQFYAHRVICQACDFWKGVCLKGHALQSAQGCPIRKFEPLFGAGYAPDKPVAEEVRVKDCCGTIAAPPLTWSKVLQQFAAAMLRWISEGCPVVDAQRHAERYGRCKACPKFVGFYCQVCRCVAYLKTKVATEVCPLDPPKWT